MMGLKQHKESHVSKIVDAKTLPKLPRDPRMLPNGSTPRKRGLNLAKAPPSSLNWTSGSKTKMADSKGVLARAKREAKEIKAMGRLSVPTHQLQNSRRHLGQVVQAPAGMVNQYRTAAQPPLKILAKRKQSSGFSGGLSGPSLEDREAKLRAFTSGGKKTAPVSQTMVDSDDDDDDLLAGSNDYEEEEEGDDLFDEKPQSSSKPAHSRSTSGPSHSSSSRPSSGPSVLAAAPPKPVMPRKRPPVDVFNRGAKKPRR